MNTRLWPSKLYKMRGGSIIIKKSYGHQVSFIKWEEDLLCFTIGLPAWIVVFYNNVNSSEKYFLYNDNIQCIYVAATLFSIVPLLIFIKYISISLSEVVYISVIQFSTFYWVSNGDDDFLI